MNNNHYQTTPLTLEDKKQLKSLNFTEYQGRRIPNICNPDTKTYWFTTSALFLGCLMTRMRASSQKMPKLPATLAMGLLAISTVFDRKYYDGRDLKNMTQSLERNLEFSPITRNALDKALVRNLEFQRKLRKEISVLEEKLN